MQFSFYQERISNFVCCFWLSLGYFKYKFNLRIVFLIGIMWTFIIVKFQIIQKTNTHNILIPNIKIQTQKAKKKKKNFEKRVDPCDPRIDPIRPIILRVGYWLTPSLFLGRKTPTYTHIFSLGSGKKMGPGQILPGLERSVV